MSIHFPAILIVIASVGCQHQVSDVSKSGEATSPSEESQALAATDGTESSNTEGESLAPSESTRQANSNELAHSDSEADAHRGRGGHGPGMGRGIGMGRGMGRGPRAMGGMREDMTTIHSMFGNRENIQRKVKDLPDGAVATTESDDEEIAGFIQEHVPAMENRVLGNKPLPPMTSHPIFVELIKHADDYSLEYEDTDKGVKATYTAEDPYVVMLVQEHAKLVSRFLKNGMSEIHKPYTLPELNRSEPDGTTVGTKAKTKAIAAKDALFARLSARLTEVIQSAGPAAAIEVCSREAETIAKAVGKEHGLNIGRTALKLRNPKNAPPEWVKPLIDEPKSEPQFVNLPAHRTGALLPIKLKAKCTTCHGPADTIKEEVRTQLAKLYPDDQATGFKEGDLRGWFWVEISADSER